MKQTSVKETESTSSRAIGNHHSAKQTIPVKDNRLESMQLKEVKEMMQNSPRMAVQRQQFDSVLGRGTAEAGSNETGMPDNLKTGLENLSGFDLSDVKVHYNSPKPAQLQALAYAQGNEIHLGHGQEKHLPHEGWHVVQQKQGRVKPTMQMKGVAVNDDHGLEKEADAMGEKAAQFKAQGAIKDVKEAGNEISSPALCIQRAKIVGKSVGFGMHHWELQYTDLEGSPAQIGVISTTSDRDTKDTTGKAKNLLKGKATVRIVNKHLSGYEQVSNLNDSTIDSKVHEEGEKLKGTQIEFNQITNNCQDFVAGIWTKCGGQPDADPHRERDKLINELTRRPTEDEVAQNLANSYMFM